ncbi:hypothetical protein VKT23_010286 [Stygiomarasmius scandens]|uniref:HNH nuclease domain-containing protein n=1 Tax=Marasmiellus scandens TaxID=2682957 RepID=A0ABR1JFA8_9AGAR
MSIHDENSTSTLPPATVSSNRILFTVWQKTVQEGENIKRYQVVLKLPLRVARDCGCPPVKWLRYVAWTIHHVDGKIEIVRGDDHVELINDETIPLEGGAHYRHIPANDVVPYEQVVDVNLVKPGASSLKSEVQRRQLGFADQLFERDGGCIFSSASCGWCDSAHIFPFKNGSKLLATALKTHGEEEIDSVDDIRNGFTLNMLLHQAFDRRDFAVLVTPNPVLEESDMSVAPRSQGLLDEMKKVIGPMVDTEAPEDMEENAKDSSEDLGGVVDVTVEQADEPTPAVVVQEHLKQRKYCQKPPSGIQYMLHWLIPESLRNQDSFMHPIPNNTIAVFNQDCDISDLPQPSICHYMYAGAILKAFASKEHSSAVRELDHNFPRAYSLQEIEEEWRKQRTEKEG